MAFVFEELSQTDIDRYDWSKFKGWIGHMSSPPSHWSIDRAKNIFFIAVQNRPHETDEFPMYAMYWKGKIIRIEAQDGGTGTFDTGVDSVWIIRRIHIPVELEYQRTEIIQSLKEAITVRPVSSMRKVVQKSLKIEFVGAAA